MLFSGSWDQLCISPAILLWVGLSLCWFSRGLFLCFAPFLWGKVSDLSAGPLLSACYAGLLIIFQFCSIVWLWMLLTVSGDKLCGPLPALFQAVAYHWPAVGPSAFPAFVYWKFERRSASCSSPAHALTALHPLSCELVFSSLFIVQFFLLLLFSFLWGWDQSAEGAMLVYPSGGLVNTTWCLVLTCWSAKYLPSRFGAGIWWCVSPPVFSV
jgi:hypothetical protein